jgi:hypothetical protein
VVSAETILRYITECQGKQRRRFHPNPRTGWDFPLLIVKKIIKVYGRDGLAS